MRHGARLLRRAPGFALLTVLTLGLGIGAATAVFSTVNAVLLAPLPYPEADRLVRLFQIDRDGRRMGNVSHPNFEDWKTLAHVFAAMAKTQTMSAPVMAGGEVTMTSVAAVSQEFQHVMGVTPSLGRWFGAQDQHPGAEPVAVVSARFFQARLGGHLSSDTALRIGDRIHRVVGVMPESFDYPVGAELWTPLELSAPTMSRTAHNYQVVARVARGVPLESAVAELSRLSRDLKQRYGDGTWMSDATAVPLARHLTESARPALILLFCAALVLLVIACLNVSNLQLARAVARGRELAIRMAVGAGRGRLARQLLAESLVLSLLASLAGVAIAHGATRLLMVLLPPRFPRGDSVAVDGPALVFALAAAVATSVALALTTALRVSSQDLHDALDADARTMTGSRMSGHVRQALVVAQVALTVVLLAGAGLLARSLAELMDVDPGYRIDGVLLADVQWLPSLDPAVRQRRRDVQGDLLARLRALPGVEAVGLTSGHPLGGGSFADGQFLEMTRVDEIQSLDDFRRLGSEAKSRAGMAGFRVVSDGYFEAMGMRLIRGRVFEPSDGPDAPHVAVISESLARARWPGQDPLGRFVQFGNMDGDLRGFRIVGIVSDVREGSPESAPGPLFYACSRQRMASQFTLVIRSDAGAGLAPAVRRIVHEVDAELPLRVRTAEEAFDRAVAGRRLGLALMTVFSSAALVLAALGIYGLLAYLVAERTREIGIRMALGGATRDVLRAVIGPSVLLSIGGLALGLGAALVLARLMEGMLFGISRTDPVSFGAVLLLSLGVVIAASYIPARRAMTMSPLQALRRD